PAIFCSFWALVNIKSSLVNRRVGFQAGPNSFRTKVLKVADLLQP
ncbi:MAG: hypothetical protein ACI959_001854, partial [Limisphaerales bacterium]